MYLIISKEKSQRLYTLSVPCLKTDALYRNPSILLCLTRALSGLSMCPLDLDVFLLALSLFFKVFSLPLPFQDFFSLSRSCGFNFFGVRSIRVLASSPKSSVNFFSRTCTSTRTCQNYIILCFFTRHGNGGCVELLVNAENCSVHVTDFMWRTPLHLACLSGEDLPIVKFLLASGADPNAR